MIAPNTGGNPHRNLTDWTTTAGLDGTGLLALVTGGATAEGIHLATLGYEVFVLHESATLADAAERASHVHTVVADPLALPAEWKDRFGLIVSADGAIPRYVLAPQGLLVVFSADPIDEIPRVEPVTATGLEDGSQRSIWVRLDS